MKTSKKIYLLTLVVLSIVILMPFIYASAAITIKSDNEQDLIVRILDPFNNNVLESHNVQTNDEGIASFDYTGNSTAITIKVMNIVNKQVNDTKTFGPIPAENSLNLNFLTGEIEDEQKPAVIPEKQPETNVTNTETSNNSELLINELASSQASSSTGAVIGGVGNFINKSKMYIFAVLVIAVIGVLVMYGFRRKKANRVLHLNLESGY